MERDLEVESEKIAKYVGTARVQLQWLSFQDSEVNAKHVQTLKSTFELDCRRLDVQNRIPAVIDQEDLESALQLSRISQGELTGKPQHHVPELCFWAGYRLKCLHGRHRVEAAKLVKSPSSKWWAVDLYLADMSSDLRTALTEEYANEERPSDGEIYQKIRRYRREKQAALEQRWWTRLSPHKASNLRQLFRHNEFTTAFDCFLDLPGVLTGLRISTLHKMFAIRCDEEVLHYLGYINEFWRELLQGDKSAMARVDQVTVQELQLRAPWASTSDAILLRSKVLGGAVFGLFSQQEREQIWIRLQDFRGMVPSLFELFENLKCLEAWADCLRWLIRLDPRETLSMALKCNFSDRNQANDSTVVQQSETIFQAVSANAQDRLNLGYRQLYCFAMRYHREIPKKSTKQDLLARPMPTVDTARLRDMADLASRLGFESSEITALRQYPRSVPCAAVTASGRPFLVTDGPGQAKRHRCGLPHVEDYEEKRQYLFINHLHNGTDEQGEGITSFFRFRSMYLKFFGMPDPRPSHNGAANANLHTAVQEILGFPAFHTTEGCDLPKCDQTQQAEAMSVDGSTSEITTSTQRQTEQSAMTSSISQEQEQHHEQFRQRLAQEDIMLKMQVQAQEQLRGRLTSMALLLDEQECAQERRRQKLTEEEKSLKSQEQKFGQWRQQIHVDASVLEEQEQQQERRRNKLNREESALSSQEDECEKLRQHIHMEASLLEEQRQHQERRRHKLNREESALKEQKEECKRLRQQIDSKATALGEFKCQAEERMRQSLTQEQNTLRVHERGSYEVNQSMSPEQACARGRQETSFDANRIEPEDIQEWQRKLINDADISKDTEDQGSKPLKEANRTRRNQKTELPIETTVEGKQAKLWTSQRQEEKPDEKRVNEDKRRCGQEAAPARIHDSTPAQDPPEISPRLDKTRMCTKRAREEVEDSEEEVRARKIERGQKPVTKGRFQRLNNYSNSQ